MEVRWGGMKGKMMMEVERGKDGCKGRRRKIAGGGGKGGRWEK
jgi:hypothetical protein